MTRGGVPISNWRSREKQAPLWFSFRTPPQTPSYFHRANQSTPKSESNPMSISSSFNHFTPKVLQSLRPTKPIFQTPFPFSLPSRTQNFSSISIQKCPQIPSVSSQTSSSSSSDSLQPMEDLPPKLQEIIKLFQSVQDSRAKYEQLLYYGRNLRPLEKQYKTKENKVEGCVSQVWVRAFLDSDRNVLFEADSDSSLTKGLAALLVEGLSGHPAAEIARVSPDFVQLLGLQQNLTPSRNNGFLNMLKLMQRKAVLLDLEAERGSSSSDSYANSNGSPRSGGIKLNSAVSDSSVIDDSKSDVNGEAKLGSNGGLGIRGMRIQERLMRELSPVELEVEDISYQHAGHAGVKGNGDGETHFNLRIVSKEFEGKSLVKRHRLVYDLLREELQSGLHALSIVAKTPAEAGR